SDNIERDLIEQATLLNTREEYVAWEQRCDEFIESLEEQSHIKRPRLSIGNRQSVIACIARPESLKDSMRGRFVYVGAGHGLRWREIETAFESRILTAAVINTNHIEPRRFLEDVSEIVLERVQCIMQRYDAIKINTIFNGEFVAGDKRANKSIAPRNYELYRYSDLREWYVTRVVEPILTSLEEFQERDSGWALSRILNLAVNVNKHNPLRAGCHIKLPREIMLKRTVINVQSTDNACFAWSVVAALHPAQKHVERESSYPHYSTVLNLAGIEFPMTLNQIRKFEALNGISINVYAIEKGIVPIRFTDRKRSKHVNLLYVEDDSAGHFALIKELSSLVRSQITRNKNRKYFCDSTSAKLETHSEDCEKINDSQLQSENVLKCALDKMDSGSQSATHTYQHHNVFSIGYYVQCSYDSSLSGYRFRRDKDCIAWFAEELRPLPYADFRWVDDVHNFDFTTITLDSQTGYILEVDLEYPQHLHDAHTDLPFCPTREKPPGKRDDKLLATLCDKQRYVIHYRNLQQCTRHGLRIAKIHRILQFTQSPWLRDYIELNTKFRTMAKNDFEKNLYKLMNNAVFGKTMENVRYRVDVKLLTKWKGRYGAEAMIAKPNFHSRSVFSENLVAIELRKLEVKFDKPIYVGMCILDISKTCLYEFHHKYMAPVFREKCKIMYTDTDSLIYHVQCDDIYDVMKRDINKFDTSDYAVDNAYSIPLANKKVPGLMKDENNGAIMTEFVGLRAKMYALCVQGKKDAKKAKGVKSSVVAKSITFEDYTCCLNDVIEMMRRQSCIRSKLYEVYTVSETKIALSPHDDKRYIVSGSIDT
ncbi:hypothetical protein ALC57_18748, partial [Trachymyrmex cornetzi]